MWNRAAAGQEHLKSALYALGVEAPSDYGGGLPGVCPIDLASEARPYCVGRGGWLGRWCVYLFMGVCAFVCVC